MKRKFLTLPTLLLAVAFMTSCDDNADIIIDDEPTKFSDRESEWVRLSLIENGKIVIMQPNTGEMHATVEGPLVDGARYYTSNSGRYLTSIERDENTLRFFDSGIKNLEDRGQVSAAKWLDVRVEAPLPTHYASSEGHIVIFNDGDGSITHIDEAQLDVPSYRPRIFAFENTVAHHGAGFRLRNGKFAVTFKNNDEPGGIPQMVKFVDANGIVIDDNGGVEVAGIHGDAVNGKYGVFGSTDGVIVVDDQGNINLIENVEGLKAESGNWLGTLKGHDNSDLFFGRARKLGVFKINPITKTINNVYAGGDVLADMFSSDGKYYVVHTADNKVRTFDGITGSELASRTVEMAEIPELPQENSRVLDNLMAMEEPSPVLVCSEDFLYVLAPNRTQIKVLEIKSLTHVHTIELPSAVESMMKNGFSLKGN